ncbi:uncharacterized protein METZ01_LOCUS406648, partial [marine metagenome]
MLFKNSQKDVNIELSNYSKTQPHKINKVIIKMSGGADSTILAYLFALYKKEERPDIQLLPATTNGYPPKNWHIRYAKKIISKITELTGVEFGHHYTNEMLLPEAGVPENYFGVGTDEDLDVASKASSYCQTQCTLTDEIRAEVGSDTTVQFSGITANPPRSVSTFYEDYRKGDPDWPADSPFIIERDPDIHHIQNDNEHGPGARYSWQKPFCNLDKRVIYEYYVRYNLVDSLFPLTRSCENEQEKLIDPNNEKHCEKCWWCL